jgi:hypothetical protein
LTWKNTPFLYDTKKIWSLFEEMVNTFEESDYDSDEEGYSIEA